MAVDVRQELSNIDRLHKELVDEVAGLPGALHSFTPELLVDYLAGTFKECDSEARTWDTMPSTGPEEEKWGTLEAMMMEGPSCSTAKEEAAAMDAAAERIQATIRETERTSVTRVEEMGLPEGAEDENGLILVRCKTCARVLLAGSCAAHEEQCRAAPAPFRPAASPAPSSTTASVPASSGPASISQGKPAPARRKKAASVPKSKLGPGKKQAGTEAGKPLPCSMAARQVPQLMRPPLYPASAKVPAPFLGQHMAPNFSAEARNRPGSTSGMGTAQPINSRPISQHKPAANGGAPSSQQMWASLQIPNNFLEGGLDDFSFGASLEWLDPGGPLPPAATPATSKAQPTARAAPAKPAQSKGPVPTPARQAPSSSPQGPFIPHPQRPRSTNPRRRLARMVTLPHVSAEEPGRTIPMPTPQKQRPNAGPHMATQRYQLPTSNGTRTAPQQLKSQLQQQQQLAWQLAQARAQQQQSHHQAQRQSALRQSALRQPYPLPQPSWQQQPQQQQQQQQARSEVSQGIPANATPRSQGQPRSIVQQWASNGMQAMPPGAYLVPQQLQQGTVSSGYLMQPQAQPLPAGKHGYTPQPSSQQMQGTYQHAQQQLQRQQYMAHGARMVPVHDAQRRLAQNGQPALLNGPRMSMQRLVSDFVPITSMGCADGSGGQHSGNAGNPLKRSYSGDPGLPPPTKKLASLQQLHHTPARAAPPRGL